MDIMSLDIATIAQLGTHVGQAGAIRTADIVADEIFDYVIGMVALMHQLKPR